MKTSSTNIFYFYLSATYVIVFFISGWFLIVYLFSGFIMKSGSIEFVTYHGDGYIINYPKGWGVEKNKDSGYTTMYDNKGEIFISTFDGSKRTPSQQLAYNLGIFKLGFKNFKQIESQKTINLKSGSWLEAGGTCDLILKDGSKIASREVSVVTSHRTKAGSIKLFTIDYITDNSEFDSSEQKFFQPMWQSFKFL